MPCFRLFIAEDDPEDYRRLVEQMNRWAAERAVEMAYTHYTALSEREVAPACEHDSLFLDIELPGMDGLAFARRIWEQNERIPIQFYTSHKNLAVEAFQVYAMSFFPKPSTQEDVNRCLDRLHRYYWISAPADGGARAVRLKTRRGVDCYQSGDILYAEAFRHHSKLYLRDGGEREYPLEFQDMYRLLPQPPFLLCQRSFALNLDHVAGLQGRLARMADGREISVSREFIRELRAALLQDS